MLSDVHHILHSEVNVSSSLLCGSSTLIFVFSKEVMLNISLLIVQEQDQQKI